MEPAVRQQVEQALLQARDKPRDPEANGRLGMILQAYEMPQAAIACYERARALDPKSAAWVYYLATSQEAAAADWKVVAALLREAVSRDPNYLAAKVRLAEALLAAGETAESRTLVDAMLERAPHWARVQYLAGRTRADLSAAVEHYRKACELAPRYGQAHYALAQAYTRLGDQVKAEEQMSLFRQGIGGPPPIDDPLIQKLEGLKVGSQYHLLEGRRLHDEGRLPEALQEYQRALAVNPRMLQAQVNLISVYGALGKLEEAEKHYHAAVAIDAGNPEAYYNYGIALAEQGRFREAGSAFRKSLEMDPSSADTHNNLGSVLESQGRTAEAEKSYRQAIAAQPNHREAHLNVARLLGSRGNFAAAIEHLQQTLWAEDERTPRLLLFLSDAYAKTGNQERAAHYAQEAARRARALGQTEVAEAAEKRLQGVLR